MQFERSVSTSRPDIPALGSRPRRGLKPWLQAPDRSGCRFQIESAVCHPLMFTMLCPSWCRLLTQRATSRGRRLLWRWHRGSDLPPYGRSANGQDFVAVGKWSIPSGSYPEDRRFESCPRNQCAHRLVVRTTPFQGVDTGSIPVGRTIFSCRRISTGGLKQALYTARPALV